jgi:hypothetical protein
MGAPIAANVLTNRFDNSRSGVQSAELQLNATNISVEGFGKLFTRTVDGDLYAQPLVVGGLAIGGKSRNVMFLATSRNWIYAYDAEDADEILPIWQHNLGRPVPRDLIFKGYLNFAAEIGITSTPVIDLNAKGSGTLYVVAKTVDTSKSDPVFRYEIHARELATGAPRSRSGHKVIEGSVKNAGGAVIAFDPKIHLNRPGLLLLDGVLYLAFGSHSDEGEFFGWVFAYDARTLKQLAVLNTAPDWGQGGVWQSGTGLSGDSDGFVYVVVGNGENPLENAKKTPPILKPKRITAPFYGNAILKLRLSRTGARHKFEIVDWFTASNTMELNEHDSDFIGGPVLFEEGRGRKTPRKLILGGGKDGKFYLAARNQLGKWSPKKNKRILQEEQLCNYHIHGAPVVWKNARGDISAFVWSEKDYLKKLKLAGNNFLKKPLSTSVYGLPQDELRMPGGMLALSWDGRNDETAVVWASHPTDDDAMNKTVNGTLRAFDARDLNRELWNSDMDAEGMDRVGRFAKFCPPVVANGKVYLSTFSRELAVYGLFSEVGKPSRQDLAGIFELQGIGPGVQKSGSYACSRYDLRVSGQGIAGNQDSFLFAHVERDSDSESEIAITVRVDGINASQFPNARVGVMIRKFVRGGDNEAAIHRFVALVVTNQNRVLFLHRDQEAGTVMQDGPVDTTLPCFLRLRLVRSNVNGYFDCESQYSRDGVVWERPVNAATRILLDGRLSVGLVATAQTGAAPSEDILEAHASFSKIEVVPAESPVTVD